ncbi:MAG: hypothetical protein QOH59_2738 [Gemmatimonadales bacterium]|nr:hypothetical protein [Gemmatimonadales bacterium]
MCYFLYIASPLTLSEVRSMLPAGLTADLASFPDQQTLKALHPPTQTVARILAGRCSCDLVRPRLDEPREDERHLRERCRKLRVPRPLVIQALERHRQGSRQTLSEPAEALSRFVAEHARNAGSCLYHLQFSPEAGPLSTLGEARRLTVAQVTADPHGWLSEAAPTFVSR